MLLAGDPEGVDGVERLFALFKVSKTLLRFTGVTGACAEDDEDADASADEDDEVVLDLLDGMFHG